MVAQTIQFDTVSVSEIGSGTITAFLFSGTTLAATLGSIAENGTLKGRNTGVVNDIAASRYRLVVKFDGYTVSESDEVVDLLLAVGTYVSYRAAVLDSSVRVKLDASQPDYAPATAAALATAYAVIQLTDTDVSAMEARLPSDPADQSAVEAAITAATSPLATSSALSTAAGNITTILGKFTGITLLARWLGALAGKTADTTTRTEINATTAGAGYNETTDSQEAIRDRGDAAWITGSGGGTGARVVTVTVNDGTSVLQNAAVRMAEGSNEYTATTNASGVATFNLNDATYTVSIGKDGYSYGGTSLVVNGTEAVTYSMTAISVTPSTGNFTTAYLTVFGREGAVAAGVTVRLQIVRLGTSFSGAAYNGEIRSEVSGVDGVVQFLNVPKDSEILIWIGEKKTKSTTSVPSTAGSTFALPSIVSAP